jgi:hypothetical protein
MNKTFKVVGIVVLALVVAGALLGGGFLIGRAVTSRESAANPQAGGAYGPGTMPNWDGGQAPYNGPGIMGRGGSGPELDGRHLPGGMPDRSGRGLAANAEPLTIEATRKAVQTFLDKLGRENLAVGEIMVFDNHAYAVIEDTSSGQGAFEVLVEPGRQVVHLENGPSVMWNTVYGVNGTDPIPGVGRTGGMMGEQDGYGPTTITSDASPLTEAEARAKAAAYLADAYPDQTLAATAKAFPGYFTFDTESKGTPVSMLSVNAYTGQVWYHTWHGTFVEMSE